MIPAGRQSKCMDSEMRFLGYFKQQKDKQNDWGVRSKEVRHMVRVELVCTFVELWSMGGSLDFIRSVMSLKDPWQASGLF